MHSFTNLSLCRLLKYKAAQCAVDVAMCNPSSVLLLYLSSLQAAAQTPCPSLPFPLIKAVICVCLLNTVWSGREDVYCTECIHAGKVGCPPLLRSLRLCTVRNSRTTQSGCVRHCPKHTVDLFWHPSVCEGSKSEKGKVTKACTEVELQTVSSSRALTAHFEMLFCVCISYERQFRPCQERSQWHKSNRKLGLGSSVRAVFSLNSSKPSKYHVSFLLWAVYS